MLYEAEFCLCWIYEMHLRPIGYPYREVAY
jgi:hypothetical protein